MKLICNTSTQYKSIVLPAFFHGNLPTLNIFLKAHLGIFVAWTPDQAYNIDLTPSRSLPYIFNHLFQKKMTCISILKTLRCPPSNKV